MASQKKTRIAQMFWSHTGLLFINFFVINNISVQITISAKYTVQYIMTHNLSFYCIRIFLFIFSSPTYDWCDTEGQQRATILGVGGRQSWTGNHGNTVLASLIPWPCQRVDKYLRKPRPIQHMHKRQPSQSTRYENTPGKNSWWWTVIFLQYLHITHHQTNRHGYCFHPLSL